MREDAGNRGFGEGVMREKVVFNGGGGEKQRHELSSVGIDWDEGERVVRGRPNMAAVTNSAAALA
jgi:hypothetical protein